LAHLPDAKALAKGNLQAEIEAGSGKIRSFERWIGLILRISFNDSYEKVDLPTSSWHEI
jgi:hypothetical protein